MKLKIEKLILALMTGGFVYASFHLIIKTKKIEYFLICMCLALVCLNWVDLLDIQDKLNKLEEKIK